MQNKPAKKQQTRETFKRVLVESVVNQLLIVAFKLIFWVVEAAQASRTIERNILVLCLNLEIVECIFGGSTNLSGKVILKFG